MIDERRKHQESYSKSRDRYFFKDSIQTCLRAQTSHFITSIYLQEVQQTFRNPKACIEAKQTLQFLDIFIAFELELTTQMCRQIQLRYFRAADLQVPLCLSAY